MKDENGINTHKEGEKPVKAKKTAKKVTKSELIKTPSEHPKGFVPFKGVESHPGFKVKQPTPEQKSAGWKKLRAQRLLTQAIVKEMVGEDGISTENFKQFIKSLATNAKKGNAKAIEVIVKAMEDDVQKIAMTDAEGNDKDFIMRIGKVDL